MRIGQYDASSVPAIVAMAYAESLDKHIHYVVQACRQLGVPEVQYAIHDESKYSIAEFGAYAMNFHGDKSPVDVAYNTSDAFATAWLHHIHCNPHHWQHWIFPDGYAPRGSHVIAGVVEMPQHYALEMIADWMGASMAYTGSFDMMGWLWDNIPRIRVHTNTAEFVRARLDAMGYADVVGMPFASEVQP